MLPTATYFKQCVEEIGLNDSDEIVLYDTHGLFSATRAWWMFQVFNKNVKVYILNGGFPRWLAENRPVEAGESATPSTPGSFYIKPDYSSVYVLDQVMDLIKAYQKGETSMTVIDSRPQGRFDGTQPEPRPGLTCGHMPGSISMPFSIFTNPEKNFEIRPREELQQLFDKAGIDLTRKETIVFSCGSGNTACVSLFAAHLLNRNTG